MILIKNGFLFIIFVFSNSLLGQNLSDNQELYFHFGTEKTNKAISISKAKPFKVNKYGFDFGTSAAVHLEENTALASETVYFSVGLPQGNYKVVVQLGSDSISTTNTIKAESRRTMLAQKNIAAGKTFSYGFIVEVKSRIINDQESVNLKDREKSALNWDNKLTLEFAKGTAVRELAITKQDSIKTLFLAGDSTVTDQDLSPWASWGQFVTQYFNDKIVVANYAASGASLASFKSRKRWAKILSLIKEGDYVMIEFGHNDQKRKGEGIGPWQSYTDLLKEYVTRTRQKGGIPILITPTQRRSFANDGTLNETHGDYPSAMRKVAENLNVPLIDLTKMTTVLYESWGKKSSRYAFVQYPANTFPGQEKAIEDNTHFNDFGANEIALCVVSGIKEIDIGLEEYLCKTSHYSPRIPNDADKWTLPMSPRYKATKPDGN